MVNDFGVGEMLGMQEALQERYKDKWEPIVPECSKSHLLWMVGEIGAVEHQQELIEKSLEGVS